MLLHVGERTLEDDHLLGQSLRNERVPDWAVELDCLQGTEPQREGLRVPSPARTFVFAEEIGQLFAQVLVGDDVDGGL
ncbi:MAG: hypothetical protein U0441_09700 [Polyangiaceae bacterium]